MLLRRGADVSSLCTLDGSPAAPQMTPLEVAKHFKSTLCIEVLEKSAQRGGGGGGATGVAASLGEDASKPALANHASGRAIRRTQAGTDVKNTRSSAVPTQPSSSDLGAAPAPANKVLSPGYDIVPGQPVNQRPSGPGYQGLPPADAKNRPPAALPPGATPPFGGIAEVQSEYDAVPKELRASLVSSASSAAIGSPRFGDPAAAGLVDGGNEYDSVPTELHTIKAAKEQSRVQRKSTDLSSEYGKAPPPANGRYLSANVPVPSTGTLGSFANSSGEYAKAPVPLSGFDARYGAVPGERPPEDDNQYDSIPNELVGSATAALKGYTAAPAMGVGRSPMRTNTGGVPAPVAKPPKPTPQSLSPTQPPQPQQHQHQHQQQPPQQPPQQQQPIAPNDPAASRDFKVALSTARIGRHFKATWSRTDAENYLRGKPANTFVLRPTTQKDGLITLSFVHPVNGSVQHSLIYDRDGGFTFDEEFGCPPAKSLLGLLQWQKLDV
jgi:hypothetical protein